MARRLAFRYLPGKSPLHRWDARCKLPVLLILSIACLHAAPVFLPVMAALFVVAAIVSRFSARVAAGFVTTWLPILIILFLVNAVGTAGEPLHPELAWLPLSREGVALAGLTCARIALLLAFANLFTAVTEPRAVRDAITWMLNPLPWVPARRVGFMASLAMRFLPLLLDELDAVSTACKARLGDRERNPLRRIKHIALPLMRRAFSRADELALAITARGYRDDLPVRPSPIPRHHWLPVIGSTALAVIALVI